MVITQRLRGWLPRGGLLSDSVWQARHRGLLVLVWTESLGLMLFGLARGYAPTHAVLEGGAVAVAGIAAVVTTNRLLQSIFVTAGLLSASAILVHLSGGTIEAHFHFFVVVTLITLYQEWWPFLLSIAYVVLHHGVAGTLDPDSVYNHAAAVRSPFLWASIHGLFILGASVAGVIVWKRNEDLRLRERAQALELNDSIVQGLVAAKMSIELGAEQKTGSLIQATLNHAQDIVSDIMNETSRSKQWDAGDFIRDREATLTDSRKTRVFGSRKAPN